MKFAIITHVEHKYQANDIYAYEPYVREMNLWGKYVSSCKIVAPLSSESINSIDSEYNFEGISLEEIPSFNILSFKNKLLTTAKLPVIIYKIFKACFWADHIHLRCPGNIGMLGCFVQVFFPFKKKTVKYAGNWDPKSKQPLSYRIQKWIVSNTFLTRNCQVLVYGEWENQTKNIKPFFTATYKESDIVSIPEKKLNDQIKVIFVGAFTENKQPMLSVKAIEKLIIEGHQVSLDMYGEGAEYNKIKTYIKKQNLDKYIKLHGNQSKDIVKKAFQESHFLVFVSRSEGWPKVVAESMFWSCLPISSPVSCIPFMLNKGERGALVDATVESVLNAIEGYLNNEKKYTDAVGLAESWSQEYTLDKFELEISKLL
ncbi:MAG: glycosyltransferase [Flavobacteriaceae bacterium]